MRTPQAIYAGAHTLRIHESIEPLRMRHLCASHDAMVAVLSLNILFRNLETITNRAWPGSACGGRGLKCGVAEADRAWGSCGAVGCVSTAGNGAV